MDTQSLVTYDKSFIEASNYYQTMEEMHHEAQWSSDKRPYY